VPSKTPILTDYLLENINFSRSINLLNTNDFKKLLSNKIHNVSKEIKSIKRITEKTISRLADIFEEDIFISIAPNWGGHQPAALARAKHNPDGLIDSIFHRHTMRMPSDPLQNWHHDLKRSSIFKKIDKQWKKEDTNILEYICNSYSDSIYPATHFFKIKFLSDSRYENASVQMKSEF
jgi:hypothetical protein